MRWLLLDEVVSIEKGKKATTQSRVPEFEEICELLMLEMMAQTGALLLGAESGYGEDVVFGKVETAFFNQDCRPGEKIRIEAACENLNREGAWVDSWIYNDQGEIARGRLMLTNVGHLIPGRTDSVTFHPAFMNHFRILEKLQ